MARLFRQTNRMIWLYIWNMIGSSINPTSEKTLAEAQEQQSSLYDSTSNLINIITSVQQFESIRKWLGKHQKKVRIRGVVYWKEIIIFYLNINKMIFSYENNNWKFKQILSKSCFSFICLSSTSKIMIKQQINPSRISSVNSTSFRKKT